MPLRIPAWFRLLKVRRKLLLMGALPLALALALGSLLVRDRMRQLGDARQELAGLACMSEVYRGLREAVAPGGPGASRQAAALLAVPACARGSDGSDQALNLALERLAADAAWQTPGAAGLARLAALRAAVLEQGEPLLAALAWHARLGSSPALDDGRHVLPVLLARLPQVMLLAQRQEALLLEAVAGAPQAQPGAMPDHWRSRLFGLDGQLTAQARLLELDLRRAQLVNREGPLGSALAAPGQILGAIEALGREARALAQAPQSPTLESLRPLASARLQLLSLTDASVVQLLTPLQALLQQRIEARLRKLWLQLGGGAALVLVLVGGLFTLGLQVTLPLARLGEAARALRRSGDYGQRVEWPRRDEFGQVARALNQVLERLARQRAAVDEIGAMLETLQAQHRLADMLPLPIVVTAMPTHELLHANAAGQALMGGPGHFWAGLEPAMRTQVLGRLASGGQVDELELRWLGGDKPVSGLLWARRVVYEGRNAVLGVFAPLEQLAQAEARLTLWMQVFEAASEGLAVFDASHSLVALNPALCRLAGCRGMDVVGGGLEQLLAGDTPAEFVERLWQVVAAQAYWQGEVRLRRGVEAVPAWAVVSVVREQVQGAGERRYAVLSVADLSERKAQELRIHHLAHHDALTGLPHRALFMERLQARLQRRRPGERPWVLMCLDVEGFDALRDARGRAACDAVLRALSQRLQETVRSDDLVCRLGAAEFAVALSGLADAEAALRLARERFLPVLRRPHEVAGLQVELTCSAGLAACTDGVDGEEALRRADAAMAQVKARGGDDASLYTAETRERLHRRRLLEGQLRRALTARELVLHWQPRVSARDGTLLSMEALLRWHSARLDEEVSPAEFVPVAEATRLIVPIGAWVIDQVCRQQALWQAQGVQALPVSINLSPVQLREPGLPALLESALQRHGIAPALLELEISEHAVMEEADSMLEKLRALKSLGVCLALDQFGTGRSSVDQLQRLPIDRLKVDRALVAGLARDAAQLGVMQALVDMGHALGLQVVAEGVEDEATAGALRAAGYDELQGYHFAHPMPAGELLAWLRTAPREQAGKPWLAWTRKDSAA